jgi:hypothetical protein
MHRIELRDKDFNLLEFLEKEAINLRFDYARIGGCGAFSFDLPRQYADEKYISGDHNIRIYIRNSDTKNYDLWYQGLIENKSPNISDRKEVLSISGYGYLAQLSRIYISETYTSQEISVIVKDILDTYVTPNTDITYDAGDIENTGFTADSLKFNTDVKRALETCANIVGSREWGVDKDRKFFFKAHSQVVGFREFVGGKIIKFSEDFSFKDIANRIVIQGGDVDGTPYTKTYNDALSQAKYNLRTKVIQNSSIVTDTVSSQFADAIFAEYSDVIKRAKCTKINITTPIESTIPIPLIQIMLSDTRYGEKKYGTFLYCGRVDRKIERVSYYFSKGNSEIINADLQLDYIRPSIAEAISQIEYQLEQQRSGAL